MRIRTILFSFITLCMLGGLVAGFFSHSIEAALTVQSATVARQTNGQPVGPGASKTPVVPATTPTTIANGANVLARDTFQRAAQTFWGTASDGRLWAGEANRIEVFSIVAGAGQVDHGQGTFNSWLGPLNTYAEGHNTACDNHLPPCKITLCAPLLC